MPFYYAYHSTKLNCLVKKQLNLRAEMNKIYDVSLAGLECLPGILCV